MIRRICFSLILVCLFIAIPLALLGIKKVDLGPSFLAFMSSCNKELNDFKIEIPDIPNIPRFDNVSGFLEVLNAVISFFNIIIRIINTFTDVVNAIISLIQFLVIVVKNLIIFRESLENSEVPTLPVLLALSLSGA